MYTFSSLADDTTLFVKDEEAVTKGLRIMEESGEVSGLKCLGRGRNRNDLLRGIKWENDSTKSLGIHFDYNKLKMEEKNWSEKNRKPEEMSTILEL